MIYRCTNCQDHVSPLRSATSSTKKKPVPRRHAHEVYDNLTAVIRCIRGVASQAYAAFEVGSAQAKILRNIAKDSRISQADLARATDTAPTLIGRALETLIERGWVRRKRSEDDRRQYVLELTASGQRTRERVEAARDGIIDRLATVLDERDAEDLDRIAKKILAAFGAEGSIEK